MNDPLTVYTLPGDDECARTIQALQTAHLPYRLVDLTDDDTAAADLHQLGAISVPVVTAGAATWTGYRPDRIHAVAVARGLTSMTGDDYDIPIDPMDALGCDSCQ